MNPMLNTEFRFHLPGIYHIATTKEVPECAFTQKIINLSKMLISYGHSVYFYGSEDSDLECTEKISIFTKEEREHYYGEYDSSVSWKQENEEAMQVFGERMVSEIVKRQKPKDFFLMPFGACHSYVSNHLGMMPVETGIGYMGGFSPFKVFESYAWLHYVLGKFDQLCSWTEIVIPNYYDLNDFSYSDDKDDYFLFVGRQIPIKGISLVVELTRRLNKKLIIAGGHGDVSQFLTKADTHVEYVGMIRGEEKKRLFSKATALLCPTIYPEPFGGVAVEAQISGTPVITTDWGAYSETVLHGKTGYRCRTFEQFLWAMKNIKTINPQDCQFWGRTNYSLERIGKMYDEFFSMLYLLDENKGNWNYDLNLRTNLDWLTKYYP